VLYRNNSSRGRGLRSALTLVLSWATVISSATALQADSLTINGQYTAGGTSYAIGTLSASVTGAGAESATFTLNAPYRNLMSDAAGTEFRFFQVITYDDEPTTWHGNIITPAGTANHTGDVVDVPSGGWDYESTTGNKGGDDTSPFYESDTANNPSTGKPYAYPGLSYPALHSADGTNPGTMSTNDSPGLSQANHKTLFETFIAYETPTMLSNKTVDILGGYSWGVQTNATASLSGIAPAYIAYSAIGNATLQELQGALNRSGFEGWTIVSNDVILTLTSVPEPSGLMLGFLAVSVVGAWRLSCRRRIDVARK
jgi:hypothetical protein